MTADNQTNNLIFYLHSFLFFIKKKKSLFKVQRAVGGAIRVTLDSCYVVFVSSKQNFPNLHYFPISHLLCLIISYIVAYLNYLHFHLLLYIYSNYLYHNFRTLLIMGIIHLA